MRALNGDGTVFQIKDEYRINSQGKRVKVQRRKPWVFRITTGKEKQPDGTWKQTTKTIGTYATRREAERAREEYHAARRKGYEVATFRHCYEQWYEEKSETASEHTLSTYRGSYKRCAGIADKLVSDITLDDLQGLLDAEKTKSCAVRLKVLLNGVFSYAEMRDYVLSNKTEHLRIKQTAPKSTKHYRFTAEELDVLWKHRGDDLADFLLVACYTGARTKELFGIKQTDIDRKTRSWQIEQGKTAAATRIVPFPDKIWPIIEERLNGKPMLFYFDGQRKIFTSTGPKETYFVPKLMEWGIYSYEHPETGKQQGHQPYDTRHTFQSMWGDLRLDNSMMEYIVGHSLKGEGKKTYTHYDLNAIRDEMNKLLP